MKTEKENPKKSPYWPLFVLFCLENGINLETEVDWKPWWDCFYAGMEAIRSNL